MAADTVSATGSDGLNRWDLLDPEAFLAEIADRVALTPGRVLLALVDEPATRQRVRGVTVLGKGAVHETRPMWTTHSWRPCTGSVSATATGARTGVARRR
jgi:hypothetical protein